MIKIIKKIINLNLNSDIGCGGRVIGRRLFTPLSQPQFKFEFHLNTFSNFYSLLKV